MFCGTSVHKKIVILKTKKWKLNVVFQKCVLKNIIVPFLAFFIK